MNSPVRLPKTYAAHLVYVLLVPSFFISFCFLYDPFGIQDFYMVGGKSFPFHFLMLTCIILAVLSLTRLIFVALYKYIPFRRWHYGIWCFGELLVCAFFMALYTALFYGSRMPYFLALSHCLKFSYLIMVDPYVFLILVRLTINLGQDQAAKVPDESLVKFYDEHKKLKLTIPLCHPVCQRRVELCEDPLYGERQGEGVHAAEFHAEPGDHSRPARTGALPSLVLCQSSPYQGPAPGQGGTDPGGIPPGGTQSHTGQPPVLRLPLRASVYSARNAGLSNHSEGQWVAFCGTVADSLPD